MKDLSETIQPALYDKNTPGNSIQETSPSNATYAKNVSHRSISWRSIFKSTLESQEPACKQHSFIVNILFHCLLCNTFYFIPNILFHCLLSFCATHFISFPTFYFIAFCAIHLISFPTFYFIAFCAIHFISFHLLSLPRQHVIPASFITSKTRSFLSEESS